MAPRACVRVYARVLVPPNLYIHTYIHCWMRAARRRVITTREPARPICSPRSLLDDSMCGFLALDAPPTTQRQRVADGNT